MPRVDIEGFDGLQPRTSPTLLRDNQAQQADNVKLYSQELRYWRAPVQDSVPSMAGVKSLYRLRDNAGHSQWLTWTTDVDAVPGPLADTSDFRVYYTGDGQPKKTNWSLATAGGAPYPHAWQYLGVPAPVSAPTAAVTGSGTGTAESRVYVYTYVNTFGAVTEESAPSPASSIVSVQPGQTVNVNALAAPPSTGYNVTAARIYRSVAGASTTSYEFVTELAAPFTSTTYNDALTTAQLGEALSTIGLLPPPTTLAGLVSLPCGSLAGFVGNTVYFSEPFLPHAWPSAYAISVPRTVIGLGVYGNNVVVCTDGEPYILTGSVPGSMQSVKIPLMEPCVAKRSIVADQYGVTYASPNGLVNISDQIREVITKGLFRRDEWQAIGAGAGPSAINGIIYDGKYFGAFPALTYSADTLVISRDDVPALSYLTWAPAAMFVDPVTAEVFYFNNSDGAIYQLDAPTGKALVYEWRSKRFVFPQALSFSCLKIDADFGEASPTDAAANLAFNQALIASGAIEGAVNTRAVNVHAVNGSALITSNLPVFVQVLLYGDLDQLQVTLGVSSFDIVRIPPFKCRELEVKISGNISVRSLRIATSVEELLGRH